nr:DKNYY domain-containing protein [Dysgonomonas sp. 511]
MNEIQIPQTYDMDIRYWTDGANIFYAGPDFIIKKADIKSFTLYTGWFAKDKNRCYFEGSAFKKADPETFEVLNWAFAKDRNHVYTNRGILKDADPNTFEVLDDGYLRYVWIAPTGFGRDKNHIFHYAYGGKTQILKDADFDSFVVVDHDFGKDKNSVFWNGRKLKNANPATWINVDIFSTDGENFYAGSDLLKGAEVNKARTEIEKNRK